MEVAWSSLVTQRNVSTDTALSHITDKRNMKTVSPCSQHTVCACFSHRCWLPVQPKALLRGRLMSCWDLPRDLHAPSSGLSSPSDASGHRQQRKHSLKDTGSGTVLWLATCVQSWESWLIFLLQTVALEYFHKDAIPDSDQSGCAKEWTWTSGCFPKAPSFESRILEVFLPKTALGGDLWVSSFWAGPERPMAFSWPLPFWGTTAGDVIHSVELSRKSCEVPGAATGRLIDTISISILLTCCVSLVLGSQYSHETKGLTRCRMFCLALLKFQKRCHLPQSFSIGL